jgi:hypothetical protein
VAVAVAALAAGEQAGEGGARNSFNIFFINVVYMFQWSCTGWLLCVLLDS